MAGNRQTVLTATLGSMLLLWAWQASGDPNNRIVATLGSWPRLIAPALPGIASLGATQTDVFTDSQPGASFRIRAARAETSGTEQEQSYESLASLLLLGSSLALIARGFKHQ